MRPDIYWLGRSETERVEETLWRTYSRLTEVEAVFRSFNSELGVRSIHHRVPQRTAGHLFVSLIAMPLATRGGLWDTGVQAASRLTRSRAGRILPDSPSGFWDRSEREAPTPTGTRRASIRKPFLLNSEELHIPWQSNP